MAHKACFKCGVTKPLDEFYRHPMMGDGHLNKCKECTKCDVRNNRAARSDYYKNFGRLYYDHVGKYHPCPVAPEKRQEISRRWNQKNKLKRQAHCKVSRALSSGALVRGPCAVCGSPDVEAHHADYSKPLDVQWLCDKHHGETRRKPRDPSLVKRRKFPRTEAA